MTTLLWGMSLPSFSAASTIAFAILSFTEPPADMNSTLATTKSKEWSESTDMTHEGCT
jgi:hypothetical protein